MESFFFIFRIPWIVSMGIGIGLTGFGESLVSLFFLGPNRSQMRDLVYRRLFFVFFCGILIHYYLGIYIYIP